MKRSIPILLVSVALLATAAPATGKEVTKVKVCGASDCRQTSAPGLLAALPEGGPPTDPPSRGAGWYRVTMTIDGDGEQATFRTVALPAIGYIRAAGENGGYVWMRTTSHASAAYHKLTHGLEPYPASSLSGLRQHRAAAPRNDGDSGASWLVAIPLIGGVCLAAMLLLWRRRGSSPAPGAPPA
jgi:hypothetical protein